MAYYSIGFYSYPARRFFGAYYRGYNSEAPNRYFDSSLPRSLTYRPPRYIGEELPSVDPFNYPGVVHLGPSFTIIGPHPPRFPPGAGIVDPYSFSPEYAY